MTDLGSLKSIALAEVCIAEISNDQLIAAYEKTGSVHKAGELIGVCGASLHRRLQNIGYKMEGNGRKFTDEDYDFLMVNYEEYVKTNRLDELAQIMGRTKQCVCRQAKKYGLTDKSRKGKMTEDGKRRLSKAVKTHQEKHGHPKGHLGHKHTNDTKKTLSEKSIESWSLKTEDQIAEITMKMLKTKAKNGTLVTPRHKVTWKQGWRKIGGVNKYYRSRWEANYARYLDWLKSIGEISSWEHEPDTFWFESIKRGCRSYLPDFKVTENNGEVVYHEVKGWMDSRSKTKLKRMAKYFPDVRLIVIEAKAYKSIEKQMGRSIEGWEHG